MSNECYSINIDIPKQIKHKPAILYGVIFSLKTILLIKHIK